MESERIFLRKWEMQDVAVLVCNLNDREMAYNLGTNYPYSKNDAKQYIEDAIKSNKEKYAIVLKEQMKIIGGCGLHISEDKVSGNMWISKEYQGMGFGTEACVLLVKYCFDTLNIDRMDNVFLSENIASQKMQERIGSIVDEKKELFILNGVTRIKRKAVLTKENFEAMLDV